MPSAAPAAVVKITSEVVSAYLTKNHVPPPELPVLIAAVHATFAGLGSASEPAVQPVKPVPAVPVRKSVADDYLVSLEDGKRYQSLKRHLTKHGLTPAEYRTKWGLPHDYPMVSPAFARQRRELAKTIGLGSTRRKG